MVWVRWIRQSLKILSTLSLVWLTMTSDHLPQEEDHFLSSCCCATTLGRVFIIKDIVRAWWQLDKPAHLSHSCSFGFTSVQPNISKYWYKANSSLVIIRTVTCCGLSCESLANLAFPGNCTTGHGRSLPCYKCLRGVTNSFWVLQIHLCPYECLLA